MDPSQTTKAEEDMLKEWERKRRNLTRISYILILIYGVEDQCIRVSLLYYLTNTFGMSLSNAAFYFYICQVFVVLGQLASGMLIGRYVDRTGNLRRVILVNILLVILGNVCYTTHYHVALICLARLIIGLNESLHSAICGKFVNFGFEIEMSFIMVPWFTMESVKSGHGIKRIADTLRDTKWINFRLNSHKISIYKADFLLRRTLIFAPMVLKWYIETFIMFMLTFLTLKNLLKRLFF